jgi:hypothetical protein
LVGGRSGAGAATLNPCERLYIFPKDDFIKTIAVWANSSLLVTSL